MIFRKLLTLSIATTAVGAGYAHAGNVPVALGCSVSYEIANVNYRFDGANVLSDDLALTPLAGTNGAGQKSVRAEDKNFIVEGTYVTGPRAKVVTSLNMAITVKATGVVMQLDATDLDPKNAGDKAVTLTLKDFVADLSGLAQDAAFASFAKPDVKTEALISCNLVGNAGAPTRP